MYANDEAVSFYGKYGFYESDEEFPARFHIGNTEIVVRQGAIESYYTYSSKELLMVNQVQQLKKLIT